MKNTIRYAAFVFLLTIFGPAAYAGVIQGPSLSIADNGWTFVGVGFKAKIDSFLTHFIYQSQGKADTVVMTDSNGVILDSTTIAGGNKSNPVDVSWSLTAGAQYYLLGTTYNNQYFTGFNQPLPSDTEIALTDTGLFSGTISPSNFSYKGNQYWAAFNDITTAQGTSVPEPSTTSLFGLSALALAFVFRQKKLKV